MTIFTILCPMFVLISLPNGTVVRAMLDFLSVPFLPGYSLIAALFPGTDYMNEIERITLGFGLGITIVQLFGFALNYTPFGCTADVYGFIHRNRVCGEMQAFRGDQFVVDVRGFV